MSDVSTLFWFVIGAAGAVVLWIAITEVGDWFGWWS